MASAKVICRTCGRSAIHTDRGWLHATDAIRSPWQPQTSMDAHPVVAVRG